jgi:hypothetical protein
VCGCVCVCVCVRVCACVCVILAPGCDGTKFEIVRVYTLYCMPSFATSAVCCLLFVVYCPLSAVCCLLSAVQQDVRTPNPRPGLRWREIRDCQGKFEIVKVCTLYYMPSFAASVVCCLLSAVCCLPSGICWLLRYCYTHYVTCLH